MDLTCQKSNLALELYLIRKNMGTNYFSNAKFNKFETWYSQKSKEIFYFKLEIEAYCLSYV